ncbi:MAG: DNA replication and repair protein RecF [Candidatus Neomarinimicrobiota bacterium]
MITKIKLKNFRIFKEKTIDFSPGVNIILGKNGVGKTSVLEAIYFTAFTKSFKAPKDIDMLKEGEDFFQIQSFWEDVLYEHAQANFLKGQGKRFIFDEENMKRFSDIIGVFPIVFQSPEDFKVTAGANMERRIYFDRFISQISKSYLDDLMRYQRLLKMRNAYLKQLNEMKSYSYDTQLDIYDEQLYPLAYKISSLRQKYCEMFNRELEELYQSTFTNGSIGSIGFIPFLKTENEENFIAEYMSESKNNIDKEIILKRTMQGCNYDKFNFFRNERPLIHFASQGEHKIWMTMLKLAEGTIIKKVHKKDAIYLLDDLFAELDVSNTQKIVEKILNMKQVLITTTDSSDLRLRDINKDEKALNIIEICQ